MARIYPQNECCNPCPVVCEVEPPIEECRDGRKVAKRFASFCEERSEDDDSPGYRGGGDKRKSDPMPIPAYPRQAAPEQPEAHSKCDCVCFMILIAYLLALAILGLAIWAFMQDSHWNGVVKRQHPFTKITDETFFSGYYLYMYENSDSKLKEAKEAILREDRWLDIAHILFFSSFVLFTIMQFSLYVTKGSEDHSKLVICYYSVFGGLALIVALFPIMSWNQQDSDDKIGAAALRNFGKRFNDDPMMGSALGLNNATMYDAFTLAQILDFCSNASMSGLAASTEYTSTPVFKRRYGLDELQDLGFCTHHRVKIVTSWLSFMFAIICLCTPCMFCFGSAQRQSQSPTAKGRPSPPEFIQPLPQSGREPHHHRQHQQRHSEETEVSLGELKKFRQYVEAESDEHNQNR